MSIRQRKLECILLANLDLYLKKYVVSFINFYSASSIYPRLYAGHWRYNEEKFYPHTLKRQACLYDLCDSQSLEIPCSKFPRYPFLCFKGAVQTNSWHAQMPRGVLGLRPVRSPWASELPPDRTREAWEANLSCWPVCYSFQNPMSFWHDAGLYCLCRQILGYLPRTLPTLRQIWDKEHTFC